jgi:hypothetical protein
LTDCTHNAWRSCFSSITKLADRTSLWRFLSNLAILTRNLFRLIAVLVFTTLFARCLTKLVVVLSGNARQTPGHRGEIIKSSKIAIFAATFASGRVFAPRALVAFAPRADKACWAILT